MLQGFLVNTVIYWWWTDLPKSLVPQALLLLVTDVQGSFLVPSPRVWYGVARPGPPGPVSGPMSNF